MAFAVCLFPFAIGYWLFWLRLGRAVSIRTAIHAILRSLRKFPVMRAQHGFRHLPFAIYHRLLAVLVTVPPRRVHLWLPGMRFGERTL
jgi:hypothetical protein